MKNKINIFIIIKIFFFKNEYEKNLNYINDEKDV